MRKKGKWLLLAIWGAAALLLAGCESLAPGRFGLNDEGRMQQYAEARYLKALRYLDESRFELAQEQFAIAAATAVSPELQNLAREGYARVDRAIAVKR